MQNPTSIEIKSDKKQTRTGKQCRARKNNGRRCNNKTNNKSGLCYLHD